MHKIRIVFGYVATQPRVRNNARDKIASYDSERIKTYLDANKSPKIIQNQKTTKNTNIYFLFIFLLYVLQTYK